MEELFHTIPARMVLLTLSLVLVMGSLAQYLARRFKIPAILLLMAAGIALGPEGLGLIHPDKLSFGLRTIVLTAVAIIVFEGSMLLDMRQLRRHQGSILGLLTVGAVVTFALSSVAIRYVLGLPWNVSCLFGSVLSLTGPTVIFPILKRLPLRENLKTIVEAESVLVDAVGILFITTLYSFTILAHDSLVGLAYQFGYHLLVGALMGGLTAAVLWTLVRRSTDLGGDLVRGMVLGVTLLGYTLAEIVAQHSGIIVAMIAGLSLGSLRTPHMAGIQQFKGDLTHLSINLVFILLAATFRLSEAGTLGWRGVAIVVLLMLVIRPLAVWLATWRSPLVLHERAFIAWMGPKGIVATSMGTLMAMGLQKAQVPGSAQLVSLIFMSVGLTVLTQAASADWVASRLGLLAPPEEPAPPSRSVLSTSQVS